MLTRLNLDCYTLNKQLRTTVLVNTLLLINKMLCKFLKKYIIITKIKYILYKTTNKL